MIKIGAILDQAENLHLESKIHLKSSFGAKNGAILDQAENAHLD